MNIKLTVFLICTAIFFACTSNKNDLEESNLKGEIWKLKETSYDGEEKFGKYQIGDKNRWGHQFHIFNESGNLIESQRLNRQGKIETVSKYIYDNNGNCTEITTYEDDEVILKKVNLIENDRITEVQVFDKDGGLTEKYQYDYSGSDISDSKIFNENGVLKLSYINEFSSGYLNKQTVKDSLGEITSIKKFVRNKKGDITKVTIEYPKDTTEYSRTFFKYEYEYEYDDVGNWIKQFQFDEEGEITNVNVRNIFYYNKTDEPKSENDFIGMWFVVDDNDWIEFRSDKKYDAGYRDRIKETGTWEIDTEQQILTCRADDPDDSRKYKFDFEGYQMVLFTIQGDEKMRLEKR